jgi:hypothetical protein
MNVLKSDQYYLIWSSIYTDTRSRMVIKLTFLSFCPALTIIIIIPYGTNSLYMSVYFLSIFLCLSFSFELKPLIDEIDDHWLTSYVFNDSSLTILKYRWYNEYKKKRISVCMVKKNHWYSSWHTATDFWPLKS